MKLKKWTLLSLGFFATVNAQEVKPKEPIAVEAASEAKQESDRITTLLNKLYRTNQEFKRRLKAIKDPVKAKKFSNEETPDNSHIFTEIFELIKKHPESKPAVQAMLLGYAGFNTEQQMVIAELMLKHHKDHKLMLKFIYGMAWTDIPNVAAIKQIKDASKDDLIRQTATASLASLYSRTEDTRKELIASYKELIAWPGIAESNPKLLDNTKKDLFKTENLSIGVVAPDIVGTDHEDKEFKLSDYRGKVVLLDFWGIW